MRADTLASSIGRASESLIPNNDLPGNGRVVFVLSVWMVATVTAWGGDGTQAQLDAGYHGQDGSKT